MLNNTRNKKMKKTIRSWSSINTTGTMAEEAKIMLACPEEEILFGDVKCEDGDKTVTVDGIVFTSIYRNGGKFTPISKTEFAKMDCTGQFYYVEELSRFYTGNSYLYTENEKIIDVDTKEIVIEDRFKVDASLYDYLLDMNIEGTDLQCRCFADGAELIEEIITDNISNIDEYDTVADFLESIKQALCDGEYLATLDTDEATVEQAYSMLDNNEYELDKGIILNHFLDKTGLKVNFLIEKLGINRTTYYRKIENDFNFSRSELMTIKEVLRLSDEDFLKLF